MGTSCAPTYANLFMAFLEQNLPTNEAILWFRYIDDIIIIWEKGKPGLNNLLLKYKCQHKDIFINWEENKEISFLDLSLSQLSDGSIAIQTYNKEINNQFNDLLNYYNEVNNNELKEVIDYCNNILNQINEIINNQQFLKNNT